MKRLFGAFSINFSVSNNISHVALTHIVTPEIVIEMWNLSFNSRSQSNSIRFGVDSVSRINLLWLLYRLKFIWNWNAIDMNVKSVWCYEFDGIVSTCKYNLDRKWPTVRNNNKHNHIRCGRDWLQKHKAPSQYIHSECIAHNSAHFDNVLNGMVFKQTENKEEAAAAAAQYEKIKLTTTMMSMLMMMMIL